MRFVCEVGFGVFTTKVKMQKDTVQIWPAWVKVDQFSALKPVNMHK